MDRIQGPTTPAYLQPLAQSVDFKHWQGRIQLAADVDELMRIVRAYLGAWKPHQLRHVPWDLAATALPSCDALVSRAVMTSHADLKCTGTDMERWLLRQMALTLSAASTRLRFLEGFNQYL
jgi:hypothetical protein